MLKNKICVLLSLSFLLSGLMFNSAKSNEVLSQQIGSAQNVAVSALASALTYLENSDKKNAIAQVKVAINNLRKIPSLPKMQVIRNDSSVK